MEKGTSAQDAICLLDDETDDPAPLPLPLPPPRKKRTRRGTSNKLRTRERKKEQRRRKLRARLLKFQHGNRLVADDSLWTQRWTKPTGEQPRVVIDICSSSSEDDGNDNDTCTHDASGTPGGDDRKPKAQPKPAAVATAPSATTQVESVPATEAESALLKRELQQREKLLQELKERKENDDTRPLDKAEKKKLRCKRRHRLKKLMHRYLKKTPKEAAPPTPAIATTNEAESTLLQTEDDNGNDDNHDASDTTGRQDDRKPKAQPTPAAVATTNEAESALLQRELQQREELLRQLKERKERENNNKKKKRSHAATLSPRKPTTTTSAYLRPVPTCGRTNRALNKALVVQDNHHHEEEEEDTSHRNPRVSSSTEPQRPSGILKRKCRWGAKLPPPKSDSVSSSSSSCSDDNSSSVVVAAAGQVKEGTTTTLKRARVDQDPGSDAPSLMDASSSTTGEYADEGCGNKRKDPPSPPSDVPSDDANRMAAANKKKTPPEPILLLHADPVGSASDNGATKPSSQQKPAGILKKQRRYGKKRPSCPEIIELLDDDDVVTPVPPDHKHTRSRDKGQTLRTEVSHSIIDLVEAHGSNGDGEHDTRSKHTACPDSAASVSSHGNANSNIQRSSSTTEPHQRLLQHNKETLATPSDVSVVAKSKPSQPTDRRKRAPADAEAGRTLVKKGAVDASTGPPIATNSSASRDGETPINLTEDESSKAAATMQHHSLNEGLGSDASVDPTSCQLEYPTKTTPCTPTDTAAIDQIRLLPIEPKPAEREISLEPRHPRDYYRTIFPDDDPSYEPTDAGSIYGDVFEGHAEPALQLPPAFQFVEHLSEKSIDPQTKRPRWNFVVRSDSEGMLEHSLWPGVLTNFLVADRLYYFEAVVRPSLIPGAGDGTFLTFRGAFRLRKASRDRSRRICSEVVPVAPLSTKPLCAVTPDGQQLNVVLKGKGLHGDSVEPKTAAQRTFSIPKNAIKKHPALKTRKGTLRFTGAAAHHMWEYDGFRTGQEGPAASVGPLGVNLESDYVEDPTMLEFRTTQRIIDLGIYGPLSRSRKFVHIDF